MTRELDLTKGNVFRILLKFAMPFLLANLLQALYGAADLFVVGQFDGAHSVAAVAIGSQVMQVMTGLIFGITTGTTVLIGMSVGAKKSSETASIIGTSIVLFSIIGVCVTLLASSCHSLITSAVYTPPQAIESTNNYILICSLGIIFIMGYNVICGIFRGLGDSKTPLYFIAFSCTINIILDFILVGHFALGASGAALATITSQGISFSMMLLYLYRKGFKFEFSRKNIRLDRVISRKILKLGTPIALQDGLTSLSFLIITIIVNQMGVIAAAALGVVEKLIIFMMLPSLAISAALATMTAQNFGAKLYDRMRLGLRSAISISMIFGAIFCLLSLTVPELLTSIFTNDSAVIGKASEYLMVYGTDCILTCFVFNFNTYFSGQGDSMFPLIQSLIATFILRIPMSFLFGYLDDSSLLLMGFAPPVTSVFSIFICFWYLRRSSRRLSMLRC